MPIINFNPTVADGMALIKLVPLQFNPFYENGSIREGLITLLRKIFDMPQR